jgi:hypothetical protein
VNCSGQPCTLGGSLSVATQFGSTGKRRDTPKGSYWITHAWPGFNSSTIVNPNSRGSGALVSRTEYCAWARAAALPRVVIVLVRSEVDLHRDGRGVVPSSSATPELMQRHNLTLQCCGMMINAGNGKKKGQPGESESVLPDHTYAGLQPRQQARPPITLLARDPFAKKTHKGCSSVFGSGSTTLQLFSLQLMIKSLETPPINVSRTSLSYFACEAMYHFFSCPKFPTEPI